MVFIEFFIDNFVKFLKTHSWIRSTWRLFNQKGMSSKLSLVIGLSKL